MLGLFSVRMDIKILVPQEGRNELFLLLDKVNCTPKAFIASSIGTLMYVKMTNKKLLKLAEELDIYNYTFKLEGKYKDVSNIYVVEKNK